MIGRLRRAGLATLILLAASASPAQPPASDDAGNQLLPFAALSPISPEDEERFSPGHCDAARSFCIQARRAGESGPWTLLLHNGRPATPDAEPARRIPLPPGEDPDRESVAIWPHLIRETNGALLIGVERRRTAGFSGGGAGATQLLLFRLAAPDAEAVEVLNVQTRYSAMIRACFSERDYRSRGACHDEYELDGALVLAPETGNGRPRLVLTTAARSFRRGARGADSDNRRYRRADLVWEADPACSYRRLFTADPATGLYAPDSPLPDCSTYALP